MTSSLSLVYILPQVAPATGLVDANRVRTSWEIAHESGCLNTKSQWATTVSGATVSTV